MDLQAYIASGVIEAYVLGTATEQEQRAVQCLSSIYPEIAEAVRQQQNLLEQYADAQAIDPPADLKDQIWAAIEADKAETGTAERVSSDQPAEAEAAQQPQQKVVPMQPATGSSGSTMWKIAAAVTLLIGVGLGWFLQQGGLADLNNRIASLTEQVNSLDTELDSAKSRQAEAAARIAILQNPDYKRVVMPAVTDEGEELAVAYWNAQTEALYLDVKLLPAPPTGKQYQLWALVDGQPVDMGVFDVLPDTLQKMKAASAADAFAVTLEDEGGKPTPDLTTLTVLGNV